MIDEKFQFAISQYADGTLTPQEAAQVEARLKNDPEARRLLEEYRRLDAMVKTAMPVPEMDWEAMTRQISAAVDAQEQLAPVALVAAEGMTWSWWRPGAMAAALLICATAAVITWKMSRPDATPGGGMALQPAPAERYAMVNVFRTDEAVAMGEVQVQIGQAPQTEQIMLLAMADAYPELTAQKQARVLISALPMDMADEDSMLLH